jgi:aminomethyltransferase
MAREIVAKVSTDASLVPRFAVRQLDVCGFLCTVAGTGYTGEDGIEIAVPAANASVVWDALVAAGAMPAGLGARDTLRLEAALPLHGHELGEGITPLQANLGWVIAWDKPQFSGREALMRERDAGMARKLYGITIEGRRPARDGTEVLNLAGEKVGAVTSGNFSPTLGHCVALALLKPTTAIGDSVSLDVRGTLLPGTVCATPFVAKKK